MEKLNWKKSLGWVLLVVGVLVIAVEVITGNAFSDLLGRLFCGNRYLVMEDGQFGDGICGFNADIQTVMGSFLSVLLGMIFLFLGRNRKKDK